MGYNITVSYNRTGFQHIIQWITTGYITVLVGYNDRFWLVTVVKLQHSGHCIDVAVWLLNYEI